MFGGGGCADIGVFIDFPKINYYLYEICRFLLSWSMII
jgi:hypothetical protein